jgi:ATP-binding cassette, subfamily C, bacteriocin exporter
VCAVADTSSLLFAQTIRMKTYKHLQKTFTLQQGQSDCGVACLLSLVKYYGGDNRLEKLRELSGTTQEGTTLLGLYQSANQIGFMQKAWKQIVRII